MVAGVIVAPLIAAVAAGASPALITPHAISASVSVNAATHLATVPATAIGINGSTYDGDLLDAAVPGLLNNAGVSVIRFPGGSESDQYNWKTNTDVQSGATEAVSFDQFVNVLHATNSTAQAMITVNYGTGETIGAAMTPKETGAQVAADWVTYANITHHDNIKYWEIGNEIYGNGTYGANWEQDSHCAAGPSNCGPAAYAANVKTYIAAMKAVDPTIVVGAVLTAPGNWPDGQTATGSPSPWNQTVLSALGNQIGFADVHWYPQNPSSVTPPGPTDAGLLGDNSQIPSMVSTLRSQLSQYSGSSTVPIMVTETNSVSSNPGKQTVSIVSALYLDQDYLTWLQNGTSNVDWWQIHNGMVTSGDNGSGLNGTANYGDYGVLSDATCGSVCEPAADTPFPAYYGLKLLGAFIQPGVNLVPATSNQSLVQSYAATEANGNLRVLMVNDDPTNSYTVSLNYAGFSPAAGTPTVSTLSGAGTSITSTAQGTASTQTIPAYSVTMFELRPSSAAGPTTPGTPTASAITTVGATLTWTASTDPAGVTGYDVLNASNTVIASVTTNSAVLTGLTPATEYVLRVRAKDAAGNLSTPSGSVTFTTAAASDTTPPSKPGTPTASTITASSVNLSWATSTDNVGVSGYDVVRINGSTETVVASPTTNSATITGLTASTGYTFAVYAKDAAGNRSTRSGTVAVTTAASGTGGTCKITYSVNDWGGGFTATIGIANTGTATLSGWSLKFTWPGNQQITNGWAATYAQTGTQMTATNLSYNGTIAPGGNTTIGFNASYTGGNPPPTAFTLNGTSCTTG